MNNNRTFKVKVKEIAGIAAALDALHLPFGKEANSISSFNYDAGVNFFDSHTECSVSEHDINLMKRLANAGDEHAKVLRGIVVWLEIDAPRYWWQEMDTYRVGTDRLSSESTMHIQGKGMDEETLLQMKANLPEGTMQRRSQMFSYQTLRRIWLQRRHHRLPQWREFVKAIATLPFADELIITPIK